MAVLDGDAVVFMKSIVPELETISFPPDQQKLIASTPHAKKAVFVFPADHTGRTLDTVISTLVHSYISHFDPKSSHEIEDMLEWLITV